MKGVEILCPDVQTARLLAQRAAQWLRLMRWQAHKTAPTFGTSTTCQLLLVLDNDHDVERAEACRRLLVSVGRQALREELKTDPHDLSVLDVPMRDIWATSDQGAALEMIAELLRAAAAGFENAS